jgi:phosphoinositide-3-kinase regulatory subunit 4
MDKLTKRQDNPSDFSLFFDVSDRRSCYIAPERFYSKEGAPPANGELTREMDVFSIGCTIAELYLEGKSLFSLSQLLKYRIGEFDPKSEVDKIKDESIRVSANI